MTLIDFVSKCNTNHFKVRIIFSRDRVLETDYGSLTHKQQEDFRDNEVISIDCTTEVEKESPITHTISIRPILLVTIRG